ncbi:MAG: hypothetical protein ACE14P_00395 [Methanotrichaceae archaeon]
MLKEEGGLHSAEALLLARYFMFSQVYCHHVHRIYDIHLKDFLKRWLPGGLFSTSTKDLMQMTDNEVTGGSTSDYFIRELEMIRESIKKLAQQSSRRRARSSGNLRLGTTATSRKGKA